MTRWTSLTLIFSLALIGKASADDLPYATDSLPQLASGASLIVECLSAEAISLPEGSRANLFSVTTTAYLKGDSQGAKLLVLSPLSLGPISTDKFKGALAFLQGPLGSSDLRYWGLQERVDPIFQLVSGEFALVELKNGRKEFIKKYLSLADGEEGQEPGVDWAKRYIDSEPQDSFIQRSIVHELERHPNNPRALEFLGWATRLKWMRKDYRDLAIDILGRNGSDNALNKLKETATDRRIRQDIRTSAIKEIAEQPKGIEVLNGWTSAKDPLLVENAKKILTEVSSPPPPD